MAYVSQVHIFLGRSPDKQKVEEALLALRARQKRYSTYSRDYRRAGADLDLLLDRWDRLNLEDHFTAV